MVIGTEGFEKEKQGFGNHTCLFSIEICVENNDAKTKDIGKTLYTCVTAFHEICLYSVNPFSTLFFLPISSIIAQFLSNLHDVHIRFANKNEVKMSRQLRKIR